MEILVNKMKNLGAIILTIWGMIQVMAMMLLAVSHGNTWILFGLLVSDLGMMYLVVDYKEKLEANNIGE